MESSAIVPDGQPSADPLSEEESEGEPAGQNTQLLPCVIDLTEETDGEGGSSQTGPRKWPKLTFETRSKIIDNLLLQAVECKLQKGVIQKLTTQFNVSTRTIHTIWAKAKEDMQKGTAVQVENNMKGNVGRKRVTLDIQKLFEVPLHKRKNQRALAYAMEVSKATVQRWYKRKKIRRHSSAIKPLLNDAGKLKRLSFCLSQIIPQSVYTTPTFHDFHDTVHIDEKWFYLSKETTSFYILPTEDDPYRTAQSKKFIPKIMFMAAVARPRIADNGEVEWDGKIGIFPFTYQEPAKRASKNRPAGTVETKPILRVTREVIREMFLNTLLPAIKAKWPNTTNKKVIIQQDNARPHILLNDADFAKVGQEDGWNIQLQCQPDNSPDLNVLDLGFFRAIDSIKDQKAPKNIQELIEAVQVAYEELTPQTLSKVFLSYQYVMEEILKHKGGNNLKQKHVGKDKLQRQGLLPKSVHISPELYQTAKAYMDGQMATNCTHTSEGYQFIHEDEEHLQV